MKNKPTKDPNDISVHAVLNDIKAGKISPETLSKSARQQCVEALLLEGYTPVTLAQLFQVCDRTIKRDLDEIYERNALEPSPELAKQLIGETLQKVRMHHAQLTRLARSKDGSIQEKAFAEYHAWHVQKEAIELLQSLGYLPSKPAQLIGDIFHHTDDSWRPETAVKEILEIERLAAETGALTPEVTQKLEELKTQAGVAEVKKEAPKPPIETPVKVEEVPLPEASATPATPIVETPEQEEDILEDLF